MKLQLIITLYVLSNEISYPLLKKYGTITMQDKYVRFESKDFDNDEEMHFKLQAGQGYFSNGRNTHDIIYYYTDSRGNMLIKKIKKLRMAI